MQVRWNDSRYLRAVKWIAFNDEEGDTTVSVVKGYLSVALVADVFGKTIQQVAEAVVRQRRK
jgi:hypothetical protein